ncbi:hypothetical protein BUE65_22400 [Klebsiella variicola]|nr:hypothetical protein BUE65_22400 [Klebsiella variicola]
MAFSCQIQRYFSVVKFRFNNFYYARAFRGSGGGFEINDIPDPKMGDTTQDQHPPFKAQRFPVRLP